MVGFFSKFKDRQNYVRKDEIYFVHIPEGLSPDEIKVRFSQIALTFANKVNENHVFLNYGKENFIEYDYTL